MSFWTFARVTEADSIVIEKRVSHCVKDFEFSSFLDDSLLSTKKFPAENTGTLFNNLSL